MIILSLSVWCLFAAVSGAIEAILYSKKGHEALNFNEHVLFAIQRGLFIASSVVTYFTAFTINIACLLIGAAILAFPLWHDGFYYITRSRIDVPTYNFASNSTTSTSTIEIPFWLRIALFIFAIGLIVSIYEIQ